MRAFSVLAFFSGQVLMKNMLKPLVMYPSLSVRVSEQQGEGTILALQSYEESHEEQSTPLQVYRKILLVLKTLHSHLLGNSFKFEENLSLRFGTSNKGD